ncbi:MAG: DUF3471 domain-containing protein [Thermomicrobiales bacterium]
MSELDSFEYIGRSGPPGNNLDHYTGAYESSELATSYRIEISDDELVWKRRRFDDKPLRHLIDDTFASDQTVFAFDRDADDRVTGFTVHTMRAFGMRFERTE